MQSSKWIRVRPIKTSDFSFIRRIASKQIHFTVPPLFVLWLLKRTNSRSCMVAEHLKFGPVAYLLSILVCERRQKVLYIWQLAASARGVRTGAIDETLLALRDFVRRKDVKRLFFTVDPASPEYRAIRRYAYSLFGRRLASGKVLPRSISLTEREYMVRVS